MKTEIDKFDKDYHEQVLDDFRNRLIECNFEVPKIIARIAIDPSFINGILELTHIRHKTKKNVIVIELLTLVIPIDLAIIKVYASDDSFLEINIGIPTKKGYRSKNRELEDFIVDQNLNLTSESIEKMKKYVFDFKIWEGKIVRNYKNSRNDNYRPGREKYNGAYGFDDDTIDNAFEGDPENYWNID
jgi:hypothetical protein